ncbi:hypothetical protein LTR17_019055 [Elasticomyces elasticus]|nr:hypothetical protein LTR17_019055 [Elasticomyces elasticus]
MLAEVFGIVELLEEILLQLPTKDLLSSQRHICGYKTALDWKKIKQASKHERYRQMSLTQPPKDLQTFFHSSGSRYWFPTMQSVVSGKTIWETVRNVDEIGLRQSDNEELEIEFNGV